MGSNFLFLEACLRFQIEQADLLLLMLKDNQKRSMDEDQCDGSLKRPIFKKLYCMCLKAMKQ